MKISRLLARIGLSVILALPAAMGILVVVSVFSCFVIGPWGGALEQLPGQDPIQYNQTLIMLLNAMLIVGPLLIGWSWAGRILTTTERQNVNAADAHFE